MKNKINYVEYLVCTYIRLGQFVWRNFVVIIAHQESILRPNLSNCDQESVGLKSIFSLPNRKNWLKRICTAQYLNNCIQPKIALTIVPLNGTFSSSLRVSGRHFM